MEYQREIEEFKAKRKKIQESIQFDAARLYEKVKNARSGSAIVSADNQTCGGCYMTVTPNDVARLRNQKEIVLCKSCQRILYLSDCLS